jgi:hypothetical protein
LIAAKGLAGSTFPPELEVFPRDGLVEHSIGFVPEAILGLKGLSRALTARYAAEGGELTLHLTREADEQAALAAFAQVKESLAKRSKAPLEEVSVAGAAGIRGELKYQGPVQLLRQGRALILLSGHQGQELVDATVTALLAKL